MLATPIYRKYSETGISDIPKWVLFNIVTSNDGPTGREERHPVAVLDDLYEVDKPSLKNLWNGSLEKTPIN
jgi:hypothetical protein